ncbi:MAG: phosphate acyltransferase [Myxococcota bacterium]|nr:phosphate acyltransferase [Myxococcota bacterium]
MRFADLRERAQHKGTARIVVAGCGEPDVLEAALRARDEGLVEPLLVGQRDLTERAAADRGLDLMGSPFYPANTDQEKAVLAFDLAERHRASVLMKGLISTSALMSVGLRSGLRRKGRIVSHVSLLEVGILDRVLMTTDGALLPYPTFEQKIDIIKNAVDVARALGIDQPKVALLSASEELNGKIPCSLEAHKLSGEARPGGRLEGYGVIEGPYDLGCALDSHTATLKGVTGPVTGAADILVAPDIVAANLLTKAIIYLAKAPVAAAAVGGTMPIAMVSRASPAQDKYHGLMLALACRGSERELKDHE